MESATSCREQATAIARSTLQLTMNACKQIRYYIYICIYDTYTYIYVVYTIYMLEANVASHGTFFAEWVSGRSSRQTCQTWHPKAGPQGTPAKKAEQESHLFGLRSGMWSKSTKCRVRACKVWMSQALTKYYIHIYTYISIHVFYIWI